MDKQLRAAVIGAGNWGRVHADAWHRNPDATLVAVCGHSNIERTQAVAGRYGAAAYTSIEEMIERERPDVLSVVTPDHLHLEPYLAAVQSGAHCMLEKPLAMTLADGEAIVAAARGSGKLCGINFNHRYATPFRLAQEHVAEGKVGAPILLHWRFTGGHYPERQQQPLAHLLYMQSHGFNMLRTFGGPIASFAGHAADPRGTGQFTTATVSLRFESGAVGSIVAGVDGDYKDPDIYTFEMLGDRGRIRVDDAIRRFEYCARASAVQSHQEQKGAESSAQVWNSHFFDDESRDFARTTDRHLAAFARAVLDGGTEPIPVEEGLWALQDGLRAIDALVR